jgi:hypothetical protein
MTYLYACEKLNAMLWGSLNLQLKQAKLTKIVGRPLSLRVLPTAAFKNVISRIPIDSSIGAGA